MAVTIRASLALALSLALSLAALPAMAEGSSQTPLIAPAVAPPTLAPTAPFKPTDDTQPDVWIFSGVLASNNETYSGTLVSGKDGSQFELKLADGASCDGSQFSGDVGLVRLSEIPCSDGRSMRALFVPQGGQALKVFGHVGDDRFAASAHLLGTEAVPAAKQTAEPTVPQVQPPHP